jgi:hypothetical protein
MSAAMTCSVEFQPLDPAQDDSSTEPETELEDELETELEDEPEIEFEEPTWEPHRVHISHALAWAILICFVLLVVVLSIWGFARGTWWY